MIWLYLGTIVAANLLVAHYGPVVVLPVSFVLIGCDLTLRDRLHDRWHGSRWRMVQLVAAGSALTWVLNRGAGRIALASILAFAAAFTVDWLVYSALARSSWRTRINGSNAVAAFVDSAVFLTLAFGWMPGLMLAQTLVKTLGGWMWGEVFALLDPARRRRSRRRSSRACS